MVLLGFSGVLQMSIKPLYFAVIWKPNSVSPALGRSWNLCSALAFYWILWGHALTSRSGDNQGLMELVCRFQSSPLSRIFALNFQPLWQLELWPLCRRPIETFCFSSNPLVPQELRSAFKWKTGSTWLLPFFQGPCPLQFLPCFLIVFQTFREQLSNSLSRASKRYWQDRWSCTSSPVILNLSPYVRFNKPFFSLVQVK